MRGRYLFVILRAQNDKMNVREGRITKRQGRPRNPIILTDISCPKGGIFPTHNAEGPL